MLMNVHSLPIGMFDSRLGGLSVVREVRALLPGEDLLYFADQAFCPYGGREAEEILQRSMAVTGALVERGAKLVVVACNTATSVALGALRAGFPGVPIVGMVPAVKPAVAATGNGKIGVLATARTVGGGSLADLIRAHGGGAEVRVMAAPGLVELVEAGRTRGPAVAAALDPLLAPLRVWGADTLVLGCTHYPFLHEAIQAVVGPGVAIIDSGAAVARRTRDVLDGLGPRRPAERRASFTLLTSGNAAAVGEVAARLSGGAVAAIRLEV